MKSLLPRMYLERGAATKAARGLPGRSSTDVTCAPDNFPSALPAPARCGLEGRVPTVLLFVFTVLFGGGPLVAAAGPSEDLDSAFRQLVLGRSYLKDFPMPKTKEKLVQDYLGTDANGVYVGPGDLFANLQQAVSSAVQARDQLGPNSTEDGYGQYIVWEALETSMSGQLYAGNSDLLYGLRVAFPIASGEKPPGTHRQLPLGIPHRDSGDSGEYAGANLLNLGYARLHFFRGIAATLDYLSTDRDGRLRAVDRLWYPESPNYTVFNSTNFLPRPRFADTNFTSLPPQPTQTAAYLYGNLVSRFGIANVSIADKLWRAAFFSKENKPLKEEMLDKATAHLRRSVHAQYLAALPFAATLSDGLIDPNQKDNEFQVARLEQVRSSVSAAVNLIDRINRREAPKLDSLRLQIDDQEIQNRINEVHDSLLRLNDAYTTAQQKIKDLDQADSLKSGDVINLRTQYEGKMYSLCGIPPSDYGGLKTPEQRTAYRAAVETTFDRRMKAGLDSPDLVDGSEMGIAAINVLRAFNDIEAAKVEIDSIPQQIRIEEERNGEVNSVVTAAGVKFAAVDVAIGIAKFSLPKIISGFDPKVEWDTSALVVSLIESTKNLISSDKETSINNINSRAAVRNLLLRQGELAARMPSVVAQARLAIANMNSLHKQLLQLIDDHVFIQEATDTLWYNNPSVVFEQSKAELEYQAALNSSVVQLYNLAAKLGSRWGEQFENPWRSGQTTSQALGTVSDGFDDFTEPESVFTIADHLSAQKFYRALWTWHLNLPNSRRSPIGAIEPVEISLRQDLLGLSDYVWDTSRLQFVTDTQRRDRNIALFRAYLLNAQKFNASKHTFELAFGVNYFTPRRSTVTGEFSALLIPQGDSDWNQRLISISAAVIGYNVTQEKTVPFTLYQFGRTYTQSFFNKNDAARIDDLTLYYSDPRSLPRSTGWEGSQQFLVNAATGNGKAGNADLTGKAITPFCDNYLLTIETSRLRAPVNLQNIEDIKFTFEWTVGPPPAFSWPSVP